MALVFWILTGDGKTDLFLVGEGSGKSQPAAQFGVAGDLKMSQKKRGWVESVLVTGARQAILTTTGRPTWLFAKSAECGCFTTKSGGKFADVTEKVGIHRKRGCVSPNFVDYDHDGDLDLYLTFGAGSAEGKLARNVLWRNNGKFNVYGRFGGDRPWSCCHCRRSGEHGFQQ